MNILQSNLSVVCPKQPSYLLGKWESCHLPSVSTSTSNLLLNLIVLSSRIHYLLSNLSSANPFSQLLPVQSHNCPISSNHLHTDCFYLCSSIFISFSWLQNFLKEILMVYLWFSLSGLSSCQLLLSKVCTIERQDIRHCILSMLSCPSPQTHFVFLAGLE